MSCCALLLWHPDIHCRPCRRALLHNLATDETLMVFPSASAAGAGSDAAHDRPAGGGACTAIAFRTGAYGVFAGSHCYGVRWRVNRPA